MESGRTFLKVVVILPVFLVVADIIGVIVCTLLDVAPLRYKSSLLPYAIWLVLGIFTGLIAYNAAGAWASTKAEGEAEGADLDWSARPGARRIGSRIVAAGALILAALAALFWYLYWSRNVAGEYFVPDSAPHSILFFLAVFGGMLVARTALMPSPAK
jgi:hypothetical protein